jgi:hypothetical protein
MQHRAALSAVAIFCAFIFALMIGAADAKPRHKTQRIALGESSQCVSTNEGRIVCGGSLHRTTSQARVTDGATVIGGRPSGCPRAYCGCAAARFLGLNDPRLNLAWNWTKFYHGPAPVAVWRHHIAIIERMTGPHTAILRDYNSGRGLSRIHERSIAGARIVGRTSYAAIQ